MIKPLQIYASGEYFHQVTEPLPDLKLLTQQVTGKTIRRVGRFIQLALIGAARCRHQQTMPSSTAVYFGSGRGDLEMTLEIMTQLFRDGQTPKPLNFVNTVSNAACFYIAQIMGLQSRSNFVCNPYFAFESVLQLAALDLSSGQINSALVGTTDIATNPLAEHRQRLNLQPDSPVGEGSHWLWLGTEDPHRPRIGQLLSTQHFSSLEELLVWITKHPLKNCILAAGQTLPETDFALIKYNTNLSNSPNLSSHSAHYDSQSGATVCRFLESAAPGEKMLHINSDNSQRYSMMLIER